MMVSLLQPTEPELCLLLRVLYLSVPIVELLVLQLHKGKLLLQGEVVVLLLAHFLQLCFLLSNDCPLLQDFLLYIYLILLEGEGV